MTELSGSACHVCGTSNGDLPDNQLYLLFLCFKPQNAANLVYNDQNSGLLWTKNGNIAGKTMSWSDAMSWAKNLSYAEYRDWRLPTIAQLQTFSKMGGNNPSKWFNSNGFNHVRAAGYWSSTKGGGNGPGPSTAYYVNLLNGSVNDRDWESNDYYVWCVRGGQ